MNKHVSLALHLRDGYKNRPIAGIAALRFTLDGENMIPVFKEGGWCIFINLEAGEHTLQVSSRSYFPLQLTFTLQNAQDYHEQYHTLSPTAAYPFGKRVDAANVTILRKKVPLANEDVMVLIKAEQPLKIAQDGLKGAGTEARLYTAKKMGVYLLPALYFIDDKAKSEWVSITGAQDDVYSFGAPLKYPHERGCALFRVRLQRTDEEGKLFLLFEEKDNQTICLHDGKGFVMRDVAYPQSGETLVSL
ncbi:hypothetical protein LJC27_02910 [Christensenellaceae bacterium OttesenSCG-928-M15]|nr:hypothetical protein [Christensenellaceae bacterium OttesenSCG-928-M15]